MPKQDKVQREIKTELKRQSRKDLLSPASLAVFAWLILVVHRAVDVLNWFGMASTFWDSVPFEGEVSLVVLAVVVLSFLMDATKK